MPWYRRIIPEKELDILKKRSENRKTYVSAFQYLRTGVAQSLFAEDTCEHDIGICLTPKDDRMAFWRESSYCAVSDRIFKRDYSSTKEFEETLYKHYYSTQTESEVRAAVKERFNKNVEEVVRDKIPSHEVEEYATLAWTEGVLHYKFQDIDKVVVNPKSIESSCKGYAFSKVLEEVLNKKVEFGCINNLGKGVKDIDRENFKKDLSSESSRKKIREYKKVFSNILESPAPAPASASAKSAFGSRSRGDGRSGGGGGASK
jgi:hypothetical protein